MDENVNFRSAINGFNRTDVLNYIKALIEENASLSAEVDSANIKIAELNAEIEKYKVLLSKREAEQQNERVLGRAMYDARRFSDSLVLEAHREALAMLNNASQSADTISEKADFVIQNAVSAAETINDSMDQIRMQLEQLDADLADFKKTIEERKETLPTHAALEDYDDVETPNESEDFSEPDADDLPEESDPDDAGSVKSGAPQPTRIKIKKIKR